MGSSFAALSGSPPFYSTFGIKASSALKQDGIVQKGVVLSPQSLQESIFSIAIGELIEKKPLCYPNQFRPVSSCLQITCLPIPVEVWGGQHRSVHWLYPPKSSALLTALLWHPWPAWYFCRLTGFMIALQIWSLVAVCHQSAIQSSEHTKCHHREGLCFGHDQLKLF